jgi:hypothetical protein
MSKIIMKLKPGKPAEIKVVGVPGGTCKALSAPFEKILGGQTISSTPTAEMQQVAAPVGTAVEQKLGTL